MFFDLKMGLHKSGKTFFALLVHWLALMKSSVGLATMFPNQSIVFGQTLISPNQMFEMGFFSPGSSKDRFLGIWFRTTPEAVVWVANRNNPTNDSQGLRFAIVGNGTLVIMNTGGIVWSANSSVMMLNPIVQLLDTGNLVLMDQQVEGLTHGYKWQSFDYPTDTLLPGMKLGHHIDGGVEKYLTSWKNFDDPSCGDFVTKFTNNGLPQVVVFKGTRKVFRTGTWNGLYFGGLPPLQTQLPHCELSSNQERAISWSIPSDGLTFTRVIIDKSGWLHHLALNARTDKWNPVRLCPSDRCDEYGQCGPFGMCTLEGDVKCTCPKGFTPKNLKDWNLLDWSGGCTRISLLDCESEDYGFLEIRGVKYPDMLQFWLNTSMSIDECRSVCLRNCSCVAFANAYITNNGSGCLMWFGELMDVRIIHGKYSKQKIYLRLPNSELDSGSDIEEEVEGKKRSMLWFVLISIVSGVLVSCFINVVIYYMARQRRQAGDKIDQNLDAPQYSLSTIISATNNFSRENLLGEGGFGPVYRGMLSSQVQIAVKRLSRISRQGLVEFNNEVTLIAKLQHRNLVRLLGCCMERDERILIYEFMHNKSLDTFIFDRNQSRFLTWPKRFEIIMGIARGLLYLHHDSRLKVIHRDLKSSNILLDASLNPKISDFGLARTFKEDQSTSRTKMIVGTYGYMSPEYVFTGNFSMKSDIFSLGVVLLEIVCGKKNHASLNNSQYYYSIVGHAWLLWKENKTLELMDECLNNTFVETQVKRCVQIGLLCVQKHPEDRPDMISVYSMLSTSEGALPEPKEPGFFIDSSSSSMRSPTSRSTNMESGRISISDVEAR